MSLGLSGTLAHAADAPAATGFPDLPYAKRWVFQSGAPTKPSRPADGRTALRYNPICTNPDLPCNGDPHDYYSEGSGWSELASFGNSMEKVEVFGHSAIKDKNAVCLGSECREYLQDLRTIYEQSTGPVRSTLWGLIRSPERLKKCMSYASLLPLNDAQKEAVITPASREFYRTNDVYVKAGDTFDVKQADGKIFRFEVGVSDSNGNIRYSAFVEQVGLSTASSCR